MVEVVITGCRRCRWGGVGWLVAVVCPRNWLAESHTTAYLIKQATKDYGLDGYLLTIVTI